MSCGLQVGVRYIIFLFLSVSSFFFTPEAADVLNKGKSIKDGESLISSGEIFELGFFSPGTSKKRYVGIWYYNQPNQTVVWVANREDPVQDLSGSFVLRENGSLAVLDGENKVLWSSNTSSASSGLSAQLLDTGNIVIRSSADASGAFLWRSFDHPGNTYLPGMQVGLDLRTNVNTLFTSWKSDDDPSMGRFSMGVDPRRTTQLMIWDGETPRWRSGPWNGQMFIGIKDMRPQNLYGFKFSNVAAEQKMYFWYTAFNDTKERFVTTANGTLDDRIWNEEKKEWQLFNSDGDEFCELYNHCGDYGVCSEMSIPACNCLYGFEPKFSEKWKQGNWSDGCSRRTPLECKKNATEAIEKGSDAFFKVEGLKLPDAGKWVANVDANACGDICLKNCSCEAYAYVSGIGCMVWGTGLLDIERFPTGGEDLYIKLAGSEIDTNKKTSKVVIIASVASAIMVIICLFFLIKWRRKIKALFEKEQGEIPLINLDLKTCDDDKQEENPDLPIFTFQTLVAATNNFSHSNIIGEGGFGPVYKGVLHGQKEIAVKRLSVRSGQGMEEFKNEVTLIVKLQHRNLVQLLGFCIQGDEKLLIYEYMVNKSLDGFIFDSTKRAQLDWNKRYNIIGGIARGLLYLHRDSRLTIIHRDLKAGNILLDQGMNPKISDFGMARIFRDDKNLANTKRVVGTYGYMSPEYAMDGLFSVKSDVYSFGVILLEIISGKKNQGFLQTRNSANLLGYAWTQWNEDKVMEFVDPSIRENCSVQEVFKCLQVGLLCVQDRASERPTMPSVVVMLESDGALIPHPKQPTFTIDRRPNETDSSSENPAAGLSLNYVTTTVMIGR